MKKTLIALAVLGSVAGVAQAQSSVTLYGLVDAWVGSNKATVSGGGAPTVSNRVTSLDSGVFSTSRFGLKGTEDLGGGLKANFQLEQGFDASNGTTTNGTAFNRQSWVGLSGGFGEVQLGRTWTPYDDTRALANDSFNSNSAASFRTWAAYYDRTSNGIRYNTPSFGGFSAAVAYALGEDETAANSRSSLTSFSLNYANGPFVAGLAYQSERDNSAATIFDDVSGLVGLTPSKRNYTLLNGSYDLGVVKLIAGINHVKGTSDAVPGNEATAKEFNIGADFPLTSALAVGVGYAQSKIEFNGTDIGKNRGVSVIGKYNLSKRTFTYATLNSNKFTFTGTDAEIKNTGFGVGVQHSF
ncbi:porin [Hydrogenophaga sp.]|uniref:porin n=1 Tax=Hydrogenophaga sp. TaxID=1904254 RepID=UPI0027193D54|nr:porin [Hydrogenophaga sp.]MDO9438355.1 porin [Hydrogenophaga sp.]